MEFSGFLTTDGRLRVDDAEVATLGRDHQRGPSAVVGAIDRHAALEQQPRCRDEFIAAAKHHT